MSTVYFLWHHSIVGHVFGDYQRQRNYSKSWGEAVALQVFLVLKVGGWGRRMCPHFPPNSPLRTGDLKMGLCIRTYVILWLATLTELPCQQNCQPWFSVRWKFLKHKWCKIVLFFLHWHILQIGYIVLIGKWCSLTDQESERRPLVGRMLGCQLAGL